MAPPKKCAQKVAEVEVPITIEEQAIILYTSSSPQGMS
jgi:hypothetical protein